MPLRDDLLNPIPGDNPSGVNLYYDPLYAKIKEARREEDDAPQGEWQHERKVADFGQVIRLAQEALATKSKDLQLAAWLTEALLKKEGFPGLRAGLGLLKGLLENFWDTLYPEIEDGDLELRAAPLDWIGDRMDMPLRQTGINRAGHNWFQYKESRSVPSEEEAGYETSKQEDRERKIADGKLTPEAFDKSFKETPKAFYVSAMEELDGCMELTESLAELCESKFGDYAPGYGKLRTAIEEVRHTVRLLLNKKRETEPDAVAEEEAAPAEEAAVEQAPAYEAAAAEAAPKPVRKAVRKIAGGEPADREDAANWLAAVASYLRREDPYSPAAYMLLRGYRWGELRAGGESIDPALLEAAPTEARTEIKRLALEGSWQQVLEAAENAMALPCGRGWLDLQRYVVRGAEEMGYSAIAAAVKSGLRNLVQDYPGLIDMTMMDDTPTANAETRAWITEQVAPPPPPAAEAPTPPAYYESPPAYETAAPAAEGEAPPPDAFQLAAEAAQNGRHQEALQILTQELATERSGRGRFQRKMQIAQICMGAGYEAIAQPILEELAREIDARHLEEWEAADMVAHPLTLLFRCLARLDGAQEERQKLYARICRLDPLQALSCSR